MFQNLNNFEIYGNDYDTFDGTCIRDYVHVCDVAQAHIQAFEHLSSGGQSAILNLGSGLGYSILQVKEIIENFLNKKVNCTYKPRRNGDPEILISSIEKAKNILNFSPKHDIVSIIATAWNWHNR